MRKGLIFIIFLILGLSIGFFIRAEESAAKYLMTLLEQEIQNGTGGCHLKYKKADLSLISITATTYDNSVECDGKVAFHFDKIILDASLKEILSSTVIFNSLRLVDGYFKGVSAKSATYKFIDYITSNSAPGEEPKIKIKLQKLTIENSSFTEELGENLLSAQDVSLLLTYDQKRNAILKPKLGKLSYIIKKNDGRTLPLGEADGSITITDTKTLYPQISLHDDIGNSLKLHAEESIGANKSLLGDSSLNMSLQYMGLPDWITANISGSSKVSEEIGSPIFTGSFKLKDDKSIAKFSPGNIELVTFNKFSGNFKVDVNNGDPIVIVSELSGVTEDKSKLTTAVPIKIENGNISGKLSIFSDTVNIGDTVLHNLNTDIDLSGPLEKITSRLSGKIQTVNSLGATISDLSFTAQNNLDIFDFSISHNPKTHGNAEIKGKLDISSNESFIQNASLKFDNYPLVQLYKDTPSKFEDGLLNLSGEGDIIGPFDPSRIKVKLHAKPTSESLPFSDSATIDLLLEGGKLQIQSKDPNDILSANLEMGVTNDLKAGKLSASIKSNNEKNLISSECSKLIANGNYSFERGSFFSGNGLINLIDFQIGCNDYAIKIDSLSKIKITSGAFDLNPLKLSSGNHPIKIIGQFNPFKSSDIRLIGDLSLASFEDILPGIDEISGNLKTEVFFTGTAEYPKLSGKAVLSNAVVSLEKSELFLQKLNGQLIFNGSSIDTSGISGEINGGSFLLNGSLNPFNIDSSKVNVTIENAAFNPTKGLSFSAGAKLGLSSHANQPTISGDIFIESADFEKKLDLVNLAREFTNAIFASKQITLFTAQAPKIPLNINITAKRNIFAVTNYFGVEMKGNVHVGGTLANPTLLGSIDTLNGWFGLRDRKFNITSGSVIFKEGEDIPELLITGESLVHSSIGDILNVYLEATGSITAPKISLSSDTGLAQSEIVRLLASSSQTFQQTQVNSVGLDTQVGGISLLDSVPLLNYSKFLRYLSQIDSISIEPQFNVQTGLIEPTITATKKLTDDLYLLGQGFIGSQVTETRLGAVYNLLPYLNIQALLINASDQSSVAFEVNSSITLLKQQKQFVSINILGNSIFSQKHILNSIRLSEVSRIAPSEMLNIRQAIRRLYRQNGYFDARILSTCSADDEYCRKIDLKIEEGQKSTIGKTIIEDVKTKFDEELPSSLIPALTNQVALTESLINSKKEILTWLRNSGYISASIDASYQKTSDNLVRDMFYHISRGRPVIFNFEGNSYFDENQFLDTINLENRKVPFGNNTGNILIENIAQIYQEAGFLDVTVEKEESNDQDSGARIINIKINEGLKYFFKPTVFTGLVTITEKDLEKWISKDDHYSFNDILHPVNFLSDTLELKIKDIENILHRKGYSTAVVSYLINKEGGNANVVLSINEGSKDPTFTLLPIKFVGADPKIKINPIPEGEINQTVLISYVDDLKRALFDAGYRNPIILLNKGTNLTSKQIIIEAGGATQAGSIHINGTEKISEEYIKSLIGLLPGDPLDVDKIRALRGKLLSQGLFSRVEVKENNTADDTIKDLEIKVTEKPLTTLDIGGGYNTVFGAHIFSDGTDRSLFKDGRSLNLRLDAYVDKLSSDKFSKGVAAFKYTDPSILGSKYVLTEDLRYQKLNSSIYEFNLDRSSIASSLYRNWGYGFSGSISHTLLSETLSNVTPDVSIGEFDTGSNILSYLGTALNLDKRDNPLNPYNGYSIILDAKAASTSIGSDATYYGSTLKATNLNPFSISNSIFVLSQSLQAGNIKPVNSNYVPISQRYYLGGRSSVRGYKENSLGPRGPQGGILGGESMLYGSIEFQYRPYESLSINTFFDAGNVFLSSYKQKLNNVPGIIRDEDKEFLRYSTGIGLRFLSPIGPIGLDLGFPINGREIDSPWRVHLNIGTNF